jgi:arylamine N-acetyltransferase
MTLKLSKKEDKLIKIFEKVQKIPYEVCQFDESKINESLKCGDCRHKSELLYRLLKKEGFEVKKIKVIFDWRDLPLPKNMLGILKRTIRTHNSLKVKVNNKWIKVDCTWNPEMKERGFPITEKWDGKSDTSQVTTGKLSFYNPDSKCYLTKKKNLQIDTEESCKFAKELNKYLIS